MTIHIASLVMLFNVIYTIFVGHTFKYSIIVICLLAWLNTLCNFCIAYALFHVYWLNFCLRLRMLVIVTPALCTFHTVHT
jgi:hypothetical protein